MQRCTKKTIKVQVFLVAPKKSSLFPAAPSPQTILYRSIKGMNLIVAVRFLGGWWLCFQLFMIIIVIIIVYCILCVGFLCPFAVCQKQQQKEPKQTEKDLLTVQYNHTILKECRRRYQICFG
jgi:hypothetical protein